MEQWLIDLLTQFPGDGNWAKRRRMMIPARWPDSSMRASRQDAYGSGVAAIKAAVTKEAA